MCVHLSEFCHQAWAKRKAEAPNLLALIQDFNATSSWITAEIVQGVTLGEVFYGLKLSG